METLSKPKFPTMEEINQTIKNVENKLYLIKLKPKKDLREGFEFCLKLLNDRLENPDNPYFEATSEEEWIELNEVYRNQLNGIEELKTIKSMAMAILCVDWLNGNKESIKFLNDN